MKKLLLLVVCTISLTTIYAQEKQTNQTVSNHSIRTNIISIDYCFEQPLGGKFAINYGGGIGSNIVFSHGTFYTAIPYIIAEPRYYYNIDKRAFKLKNTNKNSANYIALKTSLLFPPIYTNSKWLESNTTFLLAPLWGIKRVYGKHFMLDFNIGIGIAAGKDDYLGFVVIPKSFCDLKIGYTF